jgi:predicted GNAT family N-acyltransferase
MGIIIRQPETDLEWDAYYDLRFRVLREPLNQPLGSERNEGDAEGIHFALYDDSEIKAIARLDQASETTSQVRFVAVAINSHGKGYGREIMNATEHKSKELGNTKMILHARDYAVDFYLKLDYKLIEPSYKLFDVLQHFLMEKELEITAVNQ